MIILQLGCVKKGCSGVSIPDRNTGATTSRTLRFFPPQVVNFIFPSHSFFPSHLFALPLPYVGCGILSFATSSIFLPLSSLPTCSFLSVTCIYHQAFLLYEKRDREMFFIYFLSIILLARDKSDDSLKLKSINYLTPVVS